jgi:hypothetical protein
MLSSLAEGGAADLSGIGSGKSAGGGGGGGAGWQSDSGFDEALGQASKRALDARLPFDNIQGLGMIDPKLAPKFNVPRAIGKNKSNDLQALLAGL